MNHLDFELSSRESSLEVLSDRNLDEELDPERRSGSPPNDPSRGPPNARETLAGDEVGRGFASQPTPAVTEAEMAAIIKNGRHLAPGGNRRDEKGEGADDNGKGSAPRSRKRRKTSKKGGRRHGQQRGRGRRRRRFLFDGVEGAGDYGKNDKYTVLDENRANWFWEFAHEDHGFELKWEPFETYDALKYAAEDAINKRANIKAMSWTLFKVFTMFNKAEEIKLNVFARGSPKDKDEKNNKLKQIVEQLDMEFQRSVPPLTLNNKFSDIKKMFDACKKVMQSGNGAVAPTELCRILIKMHNEHAKARLEARATAKSGGAARDGAGGGGDTDPKAVQRANAEKFITTSTCSRVSTSRKRVHASVKGGDGSDYAYSPSSRRAAREHHGVIIEELHNLVSAAEPPPADPVIRERMDGIENRIDNLEKTVTATITAAVSSSVASALQNVLNTQQILPAAAARRLSSAQLSGDVGSH
ncbi:hypothetical protein H9P43_004510 [Blastocladiella emersonii ATCC 22665]|nr:hypothetical protein H9P43_004510 [Blastocladiella emersonii ATCC 22665]